MRKHILKKFTSIMLSIVLVFTMMPMMPGAVQKAQAATGDTTVHVDSWTNFVAAMASDNPVPITIVLDKDISGENRDYEDRIGLTVKGDKILDLNGKTIYYKDWSNQYDDDSTYGDMNDLYSTLFYIGETASLTVNDSAGGGRIANDGHTEGVHVWFFIGWDDEDYAGFARRDLFDCDGKLVINAGTFDAGRDNEQYIQNHYCYAHQIVSGTSITTGPNAEVIVNGGTFNNHSVDVVGRRTRIGCAIEVLEGSPKIEINGGNFFLEGTGNMMRVSDDAKITINGGRFQSKTFDHIRILNDDKYVEFNAVKDGGIANFNIPHRAWRNGNTGVMMPGKYYADTAAEKLDLTKYNGADAVDFVTNQFIRTTPVSNGGVKNLGSYVMSSSKYNNLIFSFETENFGTNVKVTNTLRAERNGTEVYKKTIDTCRLSTVVFDDMQKGPGDYVVTMRSELRSYGGILLVSDERVFKLHLDPEPAISGQVYFTSAIFAGSPVSISLDGELGDLSQTQPGRVHYQWYADTAKVGEDEATYTPTATDIGKKLSVTVRADGYTGSLTSTSEQVEKAYNMEAPVAPKLIHSQGAFQIMNKQEDQEYVWTTNPNLKASEWDSANEIKLSWFTVETSNCYYVYTRYKGTETRRPGTILAKAWGSYNDGTTGYAKGLAYPDYPSAGSTLYLPINTTVTVPYVLTPVAANENLPILQEDLSIAKKLLSVSQDVNKKELTITAGTDVGSTRIVAYKDDATTMWYTSPQFMSYYNLQIKVYDPTNPAYDSVKASGQYPDHSMYIGDSYTPEEAEKNYSIEFIPNGIASNFNTYKWYIYKYNPYGSPSYLTENEYVKIDPETGTVTAIATPPDDGKVQIQIVAQKDVDANDAATTANSVAITKYTLTILGERPVPLEEISILPEEIALKPGESYTLNSVITPINTTEDTTITWSSDDTNVALVNSNGEVEGVDFGETVITATVGGKKDTCKVTVNAQFHQDPVNGEVREGETYEAVWGTDFTPVKQEVYTYDENGIETKLKDLDPTAVTDAFPASEKEYWIRAYCSNAVYVDSAKFTVTQAGPYTVSGNISGVDDDSKVTINIYEISGNVLTDTEVITGNIGYSLTVPGKGTYQIVAECDGHIPFLSIVEIEGDASSVGLVFEKILTIIEQPKSVSVFDGETATVKVKAIGANVSYNWYYKDKGATDFTHEDAVTGDTYSVTMKSEFADRQVFCIVKDTYGSVLETDVATLGRKVNSDGPGGSGVTPTPGTTGTPGLGNSGDSGVTPTPSSCVHIWEDGTAKVVKKATATEEGAKEQKCTVCNTTVTTIIMPATVSLSKSNFTYTGKAIRKKKLPKIVVKDGNGNTIAAEYYSVKKPKKVKKMKAIGRYAYKITFKDTCEEYTGTQTVYLQITPKKTSISSAKSAKKAVVVKWKKGKKIQVTGYQLMVATDRKFTKNAKTVTVKGYRKTSTKIAKLKAKSKYYVKVRTYKTVKGVKICSGWSKKKTVKTK